MLGMSQEEIGAAVGITFQQVQKYERGLNRIGSSRLYQFATLLGVGVGYFFNDLPGEQQGLAMAEEGSTFEHESFNNKEVLALVRAYYGINDVNVRKKMLALVKSLSGVVITDDEEEVVTLKEKELVNS
jgi:transcriptional regulator with XRE-family HTH domain